MNCLRQIIWKKASDETNKQNICSWEYGLLENCICSCKIFTKLSWKIISVLIVFQVVCFVFPSCMNLLLASFIYFIFVGFIIIILRKQVAWYVSGFRVARLNLMVIFRAESLATELLIKKNVYILEKSF